MAIIEEGGGQVNTVQRWGHYLAVAWGVIALVVVVNVREAVVTATSTYVNNEAGLVAQYPRGWLLDEENADYVFRVRDMQRVGFKTTFRVSLLPISADTTPRSIVDRLAMSRSQTLAAYRILGTEPFDFGTELEAQQVTYTYVGTQLNPFLETIPAVVVGVDIVTILRGQAVIITLLSDVDRLEVNQEQFLTFVDRLEF
jgi:hypothetical protein